MYIFKHLNYNKDSNKYQMLHEKLIICTDLRTHKGKELARQVLGSKLITLLR